MLVEYLNDFPITSMSDSSVPRYEMIRPTRIGNIIAGYETYPKSRYNIDGVSLWFHVIDLAPDGSRKRFEASLATADAMVLTSASGALVAAVGATALIFSMLGNLLPQFAIFPPALSAAATWLQVVGGLVVFALFHRAAMPAHRDAAAAFRSLTDLAMPELRKLLSTAAVPPTPNEVKRAQRFVDYRDYLSPRE